MSVNDTVRESETSAKMNVINSEISWESSAPYVSEIIDIMAPTKDLGERVLIHEGALSKNKSNKQLRGYLFNDVMITVVDKADKKNNKKPVYRVFPIKDNTAHEADKNSFDIGPVMGIQGETLSVKVQSESLKQQWCKLIGKAHHDYHTALSQKSATLRQASERHRTSPPIGSLLVNIYGATNLMAADANQLSDPFVVVSLCDGSDGGEEVRTHTEPKTLNPVWQFEATVMVHSLEADLVFEVYDEDKFSSDDFLGKVKLPLRSLVPNQQTNKKLSLEPTGGIRVIMTLHLNE